MKSAGFLLLTVLVWCGQVAAAAECADVSITGATLIAAPGAQAVQRATIRVRDGRIEAIQRDVGPVVGDCVIEAEGRVVTAGLWNSHVHFTDPAFSSVTTAATLIHDMLLRYGFTSVLDTGSALATSLPIRTAIREGRIAGPDVLFASGSFVYRDGTPTYLPKGLLPELVNVAAAAPAVNAVLDQGADGIKIFSGSFQFDRPPILLPPEIIRAVTDAAHARGAFVVSHPTSLEGLVNAIDGGVDILAHTAPPAGHLDDELNARMVKLGVALIPTLKLWRYDLARFGSGEAAIVAYQDAGVEQLAAFHRAGGEILFGTDVGYMQDFDTAAEYQLMSRAGLDFDAILRTLTTNPAERFKRGTGTVVAGQPADLVVFEADPRTDAGAFSRVRYTLRAGRVVYGR